MDPLFVLPGARCSVAQGGPEVVPDHSDQELCDRYWNSGQKPRSWWYRNCWIGNYRELTCLHWGIVQITPRVWSDHLNILIHHPFRYPVSFTGNCYLLV